MSRITITHDKRGRTIKRIKELHGERRLIVELNLTKALLSLIEDMSISHFHGALNDSP